MIVFLIYLALTGAQEANVSADERRLTSDVQPTEIEVSSVVMSAIQQVEVPARVAGVLWEVVVEEGEHVQAGQLLARSDTRDAELLRQQSEIERDTAVAKSTSTVELDLAEKSLLLAESDLIRAKRSREIFARAITDEEIEHRQLIVDQARLQRLKAEQNQEHLLREVKHAEVTLEQADRMIQRCHIIAPSDGVVVEIASRAGEWVEPGEPVARIVQVDRLRAEGFVTANQLKFLKRGQKVKLQLKTERAGADAETSAEFAGTLKFVSPEIIAVDGRVRIWAEIDNTAQQLHPGMRATLIIDVRP